MEKENSNKDMDEKIFMKGRLAITDEEAKEATLKIFQQDADGGDFLSAEQRKIGVRKNLYSAAGFCKYCKYGQCKDRKCKGCSNSYGGSESLCHCMDEVSIMLPQCPYYKD